MLQSSIKRHREPKFDAQFPYCASLGAAACPTCSGKAFPEHVGNITLLRRGTGRGGRREESPIQRARVRASLRAQLTGYLQAPRRETLIQLLFPPT